MHAAKYKIRHSCLRECFYNIRIFYLLYLEFILQLFVSFADKINYFVFRSMGSSFLLGFLLRCFGKMCCFDFLLFIFFHILLRFGFFHILLLFRFCFLTLQFFLLPINWNIVIQIYFQHFY